jgi:hypothetical protein
MLDCGFGKAAENRSLRESTIDNLVDCVDRFPFAGTAAKNENAGDQLKVDVPTDGMIVILAVLAQNYFGDTNGLATVAA